MTTLKVIADIVTTSRHERNDHVLQMRANFSIEGAEPSADDMCMQQRYIDGTQHFWSPNCGGLPSSTKCQRHSEITVG